MQHRVAVATVHARPYYRIVSALKSMDVKYDSMSPEQAVASGAKVIITTQDEAEMITGKGKASVLLDTELGHPAIVKARILQSVVGAKADDQLTVGIDPGNRIGISVIYMHEEIASAVESSPERAVEQASALIGGISSRKKVVRIGDGNMKMAGQIAWVLKSRFRDAVEVEIVDEHGTSRPQNTDANRRGARDRSSARTIAFRTGRPFLLK